MIRSDRIPLGERLGVDAQGLDGIVTALDVGDVRRAQVTRIAGLLKPRAPVNLNEELRTVCDGVGGITAAQFRSTTPA